MRRAALFGGGTGLFFVCLVMVLRLLDHAVFCRLDGDTACTATSYLEDGLWPARFLIDIGMQMPGSAVILYFFIAVIANVALFALIAFGLRAFYRFKRGS